MIAGFVVAAAVMMGFEHVNSLLFPFPSDMDTNDLEAVRAFAATMPLSALVLVAAGWTVGSFAGGFATARIAPAANPNLALVTGMLLTAGGVFNAWMIQNPAWFFWGGLPTFLLFAILGDRAGARSR